jgi:hypothetical protein
MRALETIPSLSIHYGHYLTHVTRMPLANPRRGGARTVEVVKTEEKGSDVIKQLRTSALGACQFPPMLTDAKGEIRKPARW